MSVTPLRAIQDAIVEAVEPDRPIHSVLVPKDLWMGFLLSLDLPGSSEDLKKIKVLDGQPIVSRYMGRVKMTSGFNEECPFAFRVNPSINSVRVMLYQKWIEPDAE